jgi:7-cyano-7-deazaguanine reductase
MAADRTSLTALGSPAREPIRELECFEAPPGCTEVCFTSDELTSLCPITGQPDFNAVEIRYRPGALCVESKSLKLYLWSFRVRAAFAEALAAEIAREVQRAAEPDWVRVVIRQNVRGGIALAATAEHGGADAAGA